jgi:hypothetical protein
MPAAAELSAHQKHRAVGGDACAGIVPDDGLAQIEALAPVAGTRRGLALHCAPGGTAAPSEFEDLPTRLLWP